MAVTAKVYGPALLSLFNGEIDFDTDTIKALLTDASYAPDQDTHRYKSSVSGEVPNGSGYATGGVTLTGKAITYDTASNTVVIDCDDPTWDPATITARRLVIYKDTGTAGTSPLIGWVDFGADVASTADRFRYAVAVVAGGTGGILRATVA